MIGACTVLGITLFFLGDFESAQRYLGHGLEIWHSGRVPSLVEDVGVSAVSCLCYKADCDWHMGNIVSCQATMAKAISLAKELKDTHGLAEALSSTASLGYSEGDPKEVERVASDLIELSTRHRFAHWLAVGAIYRGWARSASGEIAGGISWIEDGIRDFRATGAIISVPHFLAIKAEALQLADRTSEALEAIKEPEVLIERSQERGWCAELQRLRGVYLATMGAAETQIEAAFCEAIRTAKEQKSIALAKRAEATYAEYRRQKACGSGEPGFGL